MPLKRCLCVWSQELLRQGQAAEGEAAEFGISSFVYRCSHGIMSARAVFTNEQPFSCSVMPGEPAYETGSTLARNGAAWDGSCCTVPRMSRLP